MVWRRVVEGALAGRCCQPCWPALLASPAQPVSPQGRGAMEVCHSRMG